MQNNSFPLSLILRSLKSDYIETGKPHNYSIKERK